MAKLQCKYCGGMVEFSDGETVCECPYCGNMTTFPKLNSEHREQLYSRAEHFRGAGNFDKAISTYEEILKEDAEDAEAYWGLVLSRFGIEYVEDPISHERKPTCHRVQYESILADSDYKAALEHAGAGERAIYESEAKRIAEIQKEILAISSREKPFDVFICYKETTDGGSRTKDSTIAQDIYYQLTNEGLKVFFARITLEDKLGQQYEPYIFAALNSAKVMLVIGSKKEYFNAVWVRNEWSRFLALMKKDRSRLLIPCYRDMDAYDIPEELSMLQSQDMSKIGFIQDILRGIKKVVAREEKGSASSGGNASSGTSNEIETLLQRVQLFLESGDFYSAKQYANRVLDKDPKNAQTYFYQFLAENRLVGEDAFMKDSDANYASFNTFGMAERFAKGEFKQHLEALKRKKGHWQRYKVLDAQINYLCGKPKNLQTADEMQNIAEQMSCLTEFEGAVKNADVLRQKAEKIREEYIAEQRKIYDDAMAKMNGANVTPDEYDELAKIFESLDGIPEAKEMAGIARQNVYVAIYNSLFDRQNELQSSDSSSFEDWDALASKYSELVEYIPESKKSVEYCRQKSQYIKLNLAKGFIQNEEYENAMTILSALEADSVVLGLIKECLERYRQKRRKKVLIRCISAFVIVLIAIVVGLCVNSLRKKARSQAILKMAEDALQNSKWLEISDIGKLPERDNKYYESCFQNVVNMLIEEAKSSEIHRDWRRMQCIGLVMAELAPSEGTDIKNKALKLGIDSLKEEAESAKKQGDFEKRYNILSELNVLSPNERNKIRERDEAEARAAREAEAERIAKKKAELEKKKAELEEKFVNPMIELSDKLSNATGNSNSFVELPFKMKMAIVPAGSFKMWEYSKHQVTISQPFAIGVYEVTQGQYSAVMGKNPSKFKRSDDLPVETVSWNDAMEFCKKLNELTEGKRPQGYEFSLPTESQWEFAARSAWRDAFKYAGSDNIEEVAWYEDKSGKETHSVGQKKPNSLGLYDMSGNVWEWCYDWYGDMPRESVTDYRGPSSGSGRVNRGGSWCSSARSCGCGFRDYSSPDGRYDSLGFRLALVPVHIELFFP